MEPHLAAAHRQAVASLEEGGFPVGAVIVKDGHVIGAGFNRYTQTGDPKEKTCVSQIVGR